MSGPFWTLCAAIGCLVVIFTLVSALLLVAGMCIDAWQQRRRLYVPRKWITDEQQQDREGYR